MSARVREGLYLFSIGANIVSMTLCLVPWRPTSSAVGVTLGALTIMAIMVARNLSDANLLRLRALIQKAEAETAVHEAILAKVRSGEATVAAEAATLRTM